MKTLLQASVIAALAFVVPAHADERANVVANVSDAAMLARMCGPLDAQISKPHVVAAMQFYGLDNAEGWKRLEAASLEKIAAASGPGSASRSSWCALAEILFGERGRNVPGLLIMNPNRRGQVNG